MSTDSLFKSNPKSNLFSFQTTTTTPSSNAIGSTSNPLFTTTTESKPCSLFTATTAAPTSLFSSTTTAVPANTSAATTTLFTTTLTNKNNDISNIPPAFFIGVPESERTATVQHQIEKTRSLSIGYGDRRLSGILSTELPSSEKKRQETILEIPKKRSNGSIPDPSRGIFGDGHVIKRSKDSSSNIKSQSELLNNNTLKSSNTIKVFGYPSNLTHNVIQHFVEYGKIEKYEQAPSGNWVLITYENNASAIAALKSNGVVISKSHLIGVILHETPPDTIVTQRVIPVEEATGLFKPIQVKNKSDLGSGKAGVSTMNNANNQAVEGGFFSYIKESIFGW